MFYRWLIVLSRLVGLWLVRAAAAVVAAGYFVLLPRRRRASIARYRALFPERSLRFALGCAWRQYQDFAHVYTDRLEIERRADVRLDCEGQEHLVAARAAGRGAILLMSHVGRWELSARLLGQRYPELTLLMSGMADGRARGGVDEAIRAAGMGVVTVPDGQEQPLGILAAAQRLRQGAAIALAADRAAGEARRIVRPFLGGQMAVPAAPFALAATSGAPLFVVFAVKLGPRHYRFTCHPPIAVTGRTHAEREAAMAQAATAYLERLRDVVRAHPEQWHDFGAQLPVR